MRKNAKGITIISLVVSIIIILILAGITINLAVNGGLFNKAGEALEKNRKSNYKEAIELVKDEKKIDEVVNRLSSKEYLDLCEEELNKESQKKGRLEQILVTRKTDEKIQVVTKEGWVYIVTKDGVEFLGKKDELKVPDLLESDIQSEIHPGEYTNKNVEVKLTTKITEYKLQYSHNLETWDEYKELITVEKNEIIFVRLANEFGGVGNYLTINITNIDKVAPNNFTPIATSTTNSITIIGNTTDVAATETNACSGIKAYYFSIDDGATWVGGTTATSYTFSNLTMGTTYSVKMKAVDNAGNELITGTMSTTTTTVYSVKHWQQTVSGGSAQNSSNFTLVATQSYTTTAGAKVTPAVNSYTGFTSPSIQTVTIANNGSTVINYYYTRNSYTVTINKGSGISAVSGAGTYRYGQTVTVSATVTSGYQWNRWTGTYNTTSQSYTFTMPAGNVSLTTNTTIAQAIYSSNDGSLTFIRDRLYTAGETYNGKTVTAVYIGFETTTYSSYSNVPWAAYAETIKSVSFTTTVVPANTAWWFYGFKNCSSFGLGGLNTINVTSMERMFSGAGANVANCVIDVSSFNTSKVTNMVHMFSVAGQNSTNFSISGLDKWNTASVTTMAAMFYGAGQNAKNWSISSLNWNTSNVTDMSYMFTLAGIKASSFTVAGLTSWNTSKVRSMESMFQAAGQEAGSFGLNLTGWDTSNVTTMTSMFNCTGSAVTGSFSIVGPAGWNTSKVTNMDYMFQYTGLNASWSLNLSGLNVSNVTSHISFNLGVESKVTLPSFRS